MSFSEEDDPHYHPIFTLSYILFSACFVVPPSEVASAGFTVQNLFSHFLASEEMHFIYHHIRRTTITMLVHSIIPLGYYLSMMGYDPLLQLYMPWRASFYWKLYLVTSLVIPISAAILAFHWSRDHWRKHPIAKTLGYLSGQNNSWQSVASSINVEFRRFDKFMSGVPGHRTYVTETWVLKTSTYTVHVAHQNDIHLTLSGADEHSISYDGGANVQYLNIVIGTIHENIKPFSIRLNSLEYNDLRLKLTAPVRNARNIVIQQSLSAKFLEEFRKLVSENMAVDVTENMEVEECIGCMQKRADVTLKKQCEDSQEENTCRQCYCRPMWCLECMGKWFASRQDQQHPETWLGGRSPCPTCRAVFCMLDVCPLRT